MWSIFIESIFWISYFPIWHYLSLVDVQFGGSVAVEPLTNNHKFDNIIYGNGLGNIDFRNLHKISFNLVNKLSRHQIDPI